MSCIINSPYYTSPLKRGLNLASSLGDGYSMMLLWNQAYPDSISLKVSYNIYFSTEREDVFEEGPKYVSISSTILTNIFTDFTPGDNFYFAVRATEFDPSNINLNNLPDTNPSIAGIKIYPQGILLQNLTDTSMEIFVSDIDLFPHYGVVQVGYELIKYTNIDLVNSSLIVSDRGFYQTSITQHNIDGYAGLDGYEPKSVLFWKGFEDDNTVVFQAESKFSYPHQIHNDIDGYREKFKDLLTTDLSAADAENANFRRYDYSGWHRTDPAQVLAGNCINSYIGGEYYCADGYDGVGRQIRGVSINEQNNQRQEVLLSVTGEPCVLLRRLWKGKVCRCMDSSRETPENRCIFCFGTGFQNGYDRFYNVRRSDGNIMVRFDPTNEDLDAQEGGLESKFLPNCWTLTYPTIKDRDVLIRFNQDKNEEFRYEVLNVTRQKFFLNEEARQTFSLQRIRKFDPIYQVPVIRDTSMFPSKLLTSISFVPGLGGILPHTHEVTINEGIVSLSQINQLTSVSLGHSHTIINGVVQESFGHVHNLIL